MREVRRGSSATCDVSLVDMQAERVAWVDRIFQQLLIIRFMRNSLYPHGTELCLPLV